MKRDDECDDETNAGVDKGVRADVRKIYSASEGHRGAYIHALRSSSRQVETDERNDSVGKRDPIGRKNARSRGI